MNRSIYSYAISAPVEVDRIIRDWLLAYKFELTTKGDEQFYQAGDGIVTARRCFQYEIVGGRLTIAAWVKGGFGEVPLDRKLYGVLATAPYCDDLAKLIEALRLFLAEYTAGGVSGATVMSNDSGDGGSKTNQGTETMNNNFQDFTKSANQRDEKLTTIAFVLAIIGLIGAIFTDVMYGILVDVMIYAFAARGMKTQKRGQAIAAIVLTTLSIVISVVKVMIAVAK